MTYLEAIILGIIQGITEFLPISSDGHLTLGRALFGIQTTSLTFDIAVHGATTLSILVVFRSRILELLAQLVRREPEALSFTQCIIVSMIPVGFVGLLFKDIVEAYLLNNLPLTGICLIGTGLIVWAGNRVPERNEPLTSVGAFFMGVAQALAILPGLSRSGSTIGTALLLGIPRAKAADFSFLMVIPPILGMVLLDVLKLIKYGDPDGLQFGVLAAAVGCAFAAGLVACQAMITLVKKGGLLPFAIYCWIVGLATLVFCLV
jgi:undecaprenyl-diphosphatase